MTCLKKEQEQREKQDLIAYLRQPQAIRDRAQKLFNLCCQGELEHFSCDLSKLDAVAAYVVETTQQLYPHFDVPFHSRWRHFDAGGVDRLARLNQRLQERLLAAGAGLEIGLEMARSHIDLVIVSVLLDAGAGSQWRYQDSAVPKTLTRSEGLAVASLRAFEQGLFSSDPNSPYRVDAEGLQQLTPEALAHAFQVSADNPLVGLSGRLQLLKQLGGVLASQPARFGQQPARIGNLLDNWIARYGTTLEASTLLSEILESLGSIWPGRVMVSGVNLGDVWPHPALEQTSSDQTSSDQTKLGNNLVPFHKLSQWLSYSLVEPLTAAGIKVTHLNALTGLAEYRNGGLCVDLGLLMPKHAAVTSELHLPSSPLVVEWRALTVVMLDLIGDRVRHLLNKTPEDLPLIKVLEGGTWAAGRRIAKQSRPATGAPPITVQSDGTLF
ncbi:MAG: URC4/urg3 family protein [Phormidesmis sp.]